MRDPFPIVPETGCAKKSWLWLVILCLLPMGISGVGINSGIDIIKETILLRAMQRWSVAHAIVRQLQLSPAQGRELPKVYAEYEYNFNGKTYRNTRICLSVSGADARRVHAMLMPYWQSGKPVPCYVNPVDPDEAYLFRNFRLDDFIFQVVFALIITSCGLILMGMAFCHFWRDRMIMEATLLDGIHRVEKIRDRLFAMFMICCILCVVNSSVMTISGVLDDPFAGWGRKCVGLIYVSVVIGAGVCIGIAKSIAVWQGRLKIDKPQGPRY